MIRTKRIRLRQWEDSHLTPFARMNSDPNVMKHFPSTLTRSQSHDLIHKFKAHEKNHGFAFWPVENLRGDFLGICGLAHVEFDADFVPAIEIGWRFLPEFWGKGYAIEAAQACIEYGFGTLELDQIVSFTALSNAHSEGLMKRLNMIKTGEFNHPDLDKAHALSRHVLYQIDAADHC